LRFYPLLVKVRTIIYYREAYLLSWQKKLAQGFSTASELLHFLELSTAYSLDAQKQFPSKIPLSFAMRMQKGNPDDPLLRQVLAVDEELMDVPGFSLDPLQEEQFNPHKGLLHKYKGRVLLTLTGACAINCRFCFRRHFPYQKNNPGRAGWKEVFNYIRNDPSIFEVILSGGDPLLATDNVLSEIISELCGISHITTLRFHTRIPVVFPERIDEAFLALLASTPLRKVIVLHTNHPQELNEEVGNVLKALTQQGCHLLNQSVLLAGINDDVETLSALSQTLFSYGVLPYYLHLLDKVQGTAHFDVLYDNALQLHQELRSSLPGYLVPRLAFESPGASSKIIVS
jgi:EF-P beta-lysylation protein EpmB